MEKIIHPVPSISGPVSQFALTAAPTATADSSKTASTKMDNSRQNNCCTSAQTVRRPGRSHWKRGNADQEFERPIIRQSLFEIYVGDIAICMVRTDGVLTFLKTDASQAHCWGTTADPGMKEGLLKADSRQNDALL